MNASPEDQLQLLELQSLDSAIARLAHRRRTLPELERIEALEAQIAALDDRIVNAQTQDIDLGREQAKLETDIDMVRGRMSRDQKRLDDGGVSSPRELENLSSEVASLHRRQTELEDSELELMEQRETIQSVVQTLTQQRDEATNALGEAAASRDASLASIEEEHVAAKSSRDQLANKLPSDLVALYEKLRSSSEGVGAAALHRGRCEGCHLDLNTTELKAIRDAPEDEVLRCEECRRILIRTHESGL